MNSFWSWVVQWQELSKRTWLSRVWATCGKDWRASLLPNQVCAWIKSLCCTWFRVLCIAGIDCFGVEGCLLWGIDKKQRYGLALVRGYVIHAWFADKPVGSADAVTGTLDGVKYNIWAMKYVDYMTKVMGTGSGLLYNDNRLHSHLLEDASPVQFRYSEPYQLHFQYHLLIDVHNNLWHMVPSIEGSLKTHRWAKRVFQYLLASSEVNMFLLQKHYVWGNDEKYTLLEYRRELPRALIHNSIVTDIPRSTRVTRHSIDPLVVH